MAHIQGIAVRLRTAAESGASTDDHIYVGVVGTGGGSEFPLAVPGFDDFQAGSDVWYVLGAVWDTYAGQKVPNYGTDQNHPGKREIDQTYVQYVYLRKQGGPGLDGDDAWKMRDVVVILYEYAGGQLAQGQKRTFAKDEPIWLGNEFGLQVWLTEREPG